MADRNCLHSMDAFFRSLILVTMSSTAWAQGQGTSSLKYSGTLEQAPSQFSFILPSFVVHGFQPTRSAAGAMPRKLIANGDAVITPGFGLEKISASGLLLMSAVVKDCYDNLAGTLQVGQDYRLSRDSHLALSVGFYIRQTPLDCDPQFNPDGGCSLRDEMSSRFVKKINSQWVDVIPMPFVHYSYSFYKDKDLEIKAKVIANFLVNEVGLEIPF